MKHLIGILIVFALVFGCTQVIPDTGGNGANNGTTGDEIILSLKYQNGVALVSQATIDPINQENNVVNIIRTLTYPTAVFEDHSDVRSIMISAHTIEGNENVDKCRDITKSNKDSMFSVYNDGKIDTGTTAKTNYFLPQKAVDINSTWAFQNISYKLTEFVELEKAGWPKNAAKIVFDGVVESREVKGEILFDYVNGRFLKIERTELGLKQGGGFQGAKLTVELIEVRENYNPEEIDNECLDAKPQLVGDIVVEIKDASAWVNKMPQIVDPDVEPASPNHISIALEIKNNTNLVLEALTIPSAEVYRGEELIGSFIPVFKVAGWCDGTKVETEFVDSLKIVPKCTINTTIRALRDTDNLPDFSGVIAVKFKFTDTEYESQEYTTDEIPIGEVF